MAEEELRDRDILHVEESIAGVVRTCHLGGMRAELTHVSNMSDFDRQVSYQEHNLAGLDSPEHNPWRETGHMGVLDSTRALVADTAGNVNRIRLASYMDMGLSRILMGFRSMIAQG